MNEFRIPKKPEEWHALKHWGEFDTCYRCSKARAQCRSKLVLDSWLEGLEWAIDYNETHFYVDPLMHYQCRWCLKWHLGHPKGKMQKDRLEQQRRQWLIEQRKRNSGLSHQ